MKLFDIVGDKVVVHAELLALPNFKELYEHSKDKAHIMEVIRFIVLCDYWDSPYVHTMTPSAREVRLKDKIFKNENYTFTPEEQIARDEFSKIMYTRQLKMLDSMRNKLDTISDWYDNSLEDELDEKKIQLLLAGFEKAKGTYITLDFLEKAVKSGELEQSKVRGDVKVNRYELDK